MHKLRPYFLWLFSLNTAMDNYRAIMEVAKWLGPEDLLRSTEEVNSKWREVSASRELWLDLLPVPVDLGGACPKQYYSTHFTKSVYVVTSSALKRYYVVAKIWVVKPLSKAIETDWQTSMTLPLPSTLLICGTMSRRENTFTVNTHTGKVRVLGSINPHRQGIGLISTNGVAYAFGGVNTLQTNKLDLKGTMWAAIAGATVKRAYFNPCLQGEIVYLLGGSREESQGEKYDLRTGSFSLMSLKLDINVSFALIRNETLIIVTGFDYIKRKLTSQKPVIMHKMPKPWLFPSFHSSYDPVTVGTKAFILHRAGAQVVELDLTAFTWEAASYEGEIRPRMKGRG